MPDPTKKLTDPVAWMNQTPPKRRLPADVIKDQAEANGYTVTATTNGKHNPRSGHYQGLDADIRTKDKTPAEIKRAQDALNAQGYKATYENKKTPNNPHWTAPHLHVAAPNKDFQPLTNPEDWQASQSEIDDRTAREEGAKNPQPPESATVVPPAVPDAPEKPELPAAEAAPADEPVKFSDPAEWMAKKQEEDTTPYVEKGETEKAFASQEEMDKAPAPDKSQLAPRPIEDIPSQAENAPLTPEQRGAVKPDPRSLTVATKRFYIPEEIAKQAETPEQRNDLATRAIIQSVPPEYRNSASEVVKALRTRIGQTWVGGNDVPFQASDRPDYKGKVYTDIDLPSDFQSLVETHANGGNAALENLLNERQAKYEEYQQEQATREAQRKAAAGQIQQDFAGLGNGKAGALTTLGASELEKKASAILSGGADLIGTGAHQFGLDALDRLLANFSEDERSNQAAIEGGQAQLEKDSGLAASTTGRFASSVAKAAGGLIPSVAAGMGGGVPAIFASTLAENARANDPLKTVINSTIQSLMMGMAGGTGSQGENLISNFLKMGGRETATNVLMASPDFAQMAAAQADATLNPGKYTPEQKAELDARLKSLAMDTMANAVLMVVMGAGHKLFKGKAGEEAAPAEIGPDGKPIGEAQHYVNENGELVPVPAGMRLSAETGGLEAIPGAEETAAPAGKKKWVSPQQQAREAAQKRGVEILPDDEIPQHVEGTKLREVEINGKTVTIRFPKGTDAKTAEIIAKRQAAAPAGQPIAESTSNAPEPGAVAPDMAQASAPAVPKAAIQAQAENVAGGKAPPVIVRPGERVTVSNPNGNYYKGELLERNSNGDRVIKTDDGQVIPLSDDYVVTHNELGAKQDMAAPAEPPKPDYTHLREVYGLQEGQPDHPSFADVQRRIETREATGEKGPYGKFGEFSRNATMNPDESLEYKSLGEHPELRRILDLPKMPPYEGNQANWNRANQHAMDALAEVAGVDRSSMNTDEGIAKIQQAIEERSTDRDLHETFARTVAATKGVHERVTAFLSDPQVAAAIREAQAVQAQRGGLNGKARASLIAALEAGRKRINAGLPETERVKQRTGKDLTALTTGAINDFITDLSTGRLSGTPKEWLGRQFREHHFGRDKTQLRVEYGGANAEKQPEVRAAADAENGEQGSGRIGAERPEPVDGAPVPEQNGQQNVKRAWHDPEPLAWLTPREQAVEANSIERLQLNPERMIDDYHALNTDENGILTANTDDARMLFPDYADTHESRALNAQGVHAASSNVSAEVFRRALLDPKTSETVGFLAGGAGSGKTHSGKQALLDAAPGTNLIYDGTLSKAEKAMVGIDAALAAGKKVHIVYVYANPEAAAARAMRRSIRDGRAVPAHVIAEAHYNAPKAILEMAEHYKNNPKVTIEVVDNSVDGPAVKRDLDFVRNIADNLPDKSTLRNSVVSALKETYAAERENQGPEGVPGYIARAFGLDPRALGSVDEGSGRRGERIAAEDRAGQKEAGGIARESRGGIDEQVTQEAAHSAGRTTGKESGNTVADQAISGVAQGRETGIHIPGTDQPYSGKYAIRELDDVQQSHDPFSFEKNPAYPLTNDRDYTQPANRSAVERATLKGQFKPDLLINDDPTAANGPPVIDSSGSVLGGNSRVMMLKRVHQDNPAEAAAYREALAQKAAQFGVDPADIAKFKDPVLVREVDTAGIDPQKVVTDLNIMPGKALSASERAASLARNAPEKTLKYLGDKLASEGDSGTVAGMLDGRKGVEIINRLIDDGIFQSGDRARYIDEQGRPTEAAKKDVENLLVGRMVFDSKQLAEMPADLRNKLARISPAVARVADSEWDIAAHIPEAIRAIKEAKAQNLGLEELNKRQDLLGETTQYTPEELAIARLLRNGGPRTVEQRFQRYANMKAEADAGNNLFGKPLSQEEAFKEVFKPNPDQRPPSSGEGRPGQTMYDIGGAAGAALRTIGFGGEGTRAATPAKDRVKFPANFSWQKAAEPMNKVLAGNDISAKQKAELRTLLQEAGQAYRDGDFGRFLATQADIKTALSKPSFSKVIDAAGGITRMLSLGGEVSKLGRQGGIALVSDTRNWMKGIKAIKGVYSSAQNYYNALAHVWSHPDVDLAQKLGLSLETKRELTANSRTIGGEENSLSGGLEHALEYTPMGRMERVNKAFMDTLRMAQFSSQAEGLLQDIKQKGIDLSKVGAKAELTDPREVTELRRIIKNINITTGRGDLGEKAAAAADALSFLATSPRLAVSRFQFMNPLSGANANLAVTKADRVKFSDSKTGWAKDVAKETARPYAEFLGNAMAQIGVGKMKPSSPAAQEIIRQQVRIAGTAILIAAGIRATSKQTGVDVDFDPESPDFMKIRKGENRWEILPGGLSTAVRLPLRLIVAPIRHGAEKGAERDFNSLIKFAWGKMAPLPSAIVEQGFAKYASAYPTIVPTDKGNKERVGKNAVGQPMTWADTVRTRIFPLWERSTLDDWRDMGFGAAVAQLPEFIGWGAQSYQEMRNEKTDAQLAEGEKTDKILAKRKQYIPEDRGFLKALAIGGIEQEPEAEWQARKQKASEEWKTQGEQLKQTPAYQNATEDVRQKMLDSLAASVKKSTEGKTKSAATAGRAIMNTLKNQRKAAREEAVKALPGAGGI